MGHRIWFADHSRQSFKMYSNFVLHKRDSASKSKSKSETELRQLPAGGRWLNGTRQERMTVLTGLISALRYNLCALICNSITQASRPIAGATVATLHQLVLTAQCSLAAFNYVNFSLCVCALSKQLDSKTASRSQDKIRSVQRLSIDCRCRYRIII